MALFKKSQARDSDDDTISLDDDANAWWADRDELEKVFVPKQRTPFEPDAPRENPSSAFADQYSAESLFNWASSPTPDDPTHGGAGTPLDPYRVLGLQPGASISEVVSAHRKLAKQYHPDQLHDIGEAERAAAAQRMSIINAAYQELRSRLVEQRHSV